MKAKVLKKITSDGKAILPGEIVDISEWRNARSLVSGRYLEILEGITEGKKPSIAKSASDEPKVPAKIKDSKSE